MANCSNSSSFLHSLLPTDLSDTMSYSRFTYILCFVWVLGPFLLYILSHYSLWYVWISGSICPLFFFFRIVLHIIMYLVFAMKLRISWSGLVKSPLVDSMWIALKLPYCLEKVNILILIIMAYHCIYSSFLTSRKYILEVS